MRYPVTLAAAPIGAEQAVVHAHCRQDFVAYRLESRKVASTVGGFTPKAGRNTRRLIRLLNHRRCSVSLSLQSRALRSLATTNWAASRVRVGAGRGKSVRAASQTAVPIAKGEMKTVWPAAYLQRYLQEKVSFGDRFGDNQILTRQGSRAQTHVYLQISRYFCFRRHSNVPHSTGLRLIEPTPMRSLVLLLVSA